MLQMKIRHVSAWLMLFLTDVVCIVLAGGFLLVQGVPDAAKPRGWEEWGMIFLRGIIVAIGAYCFFAAFNRDGGMMSILTVFSLTPVCAALLLALFGGEWPSFRQWVGATLAVFAVWLVVGGMKNVPP